LLDKFGGERGIRTPGTVSGSVVFKTTAIDRSAISPRDRCLSSRVYAFFRALSDVDAQPEPGATANGNMELEPGTRETH
jgi:hypothetical protein